MKKENIFQSSLFTWIVLSVFAGSVLVSCGPAEEAEEEEEEVVEEMPEEPEAPAESIDLEVIAKGETMAEIRFNVEEIVVPANAEVNMVLINESLAEGMYHNFVVVKTDLLDEVVQKGLAAGPDSDFIPEGHKGLIAASPLADPGETVEFTFIAPEAGEYTFICLYPGHVQAMQGLFIVE